jgi:uncharacterized SAM-binding protein YcdF (DUF218 family)
MQEQWNRLITYLAEQEELAGHYDLAILAGNSLPYLADMLIQLYQKKSVSAVMLTGGTGHATEHLRRNFHRLGYNISGQSETELYLSYFKERYRLPAELFLSESRSTNSGENARFSLEIIKAARLAPKRVLLLQDPLLQRRLKATFEKEWQELSVAFTNVVPRIPLVKRIEEDVVFEDQRFNGLWSKEYFISLALGEIRRLRNDRFGYGPLGTGYIDAVQLPEVIEAAYEQLSCQYHIPTKR